MSDTPLSDAPDWPGGVTVDEGRSPTPAETHLSAGLRRARRRRSARRNAIEWVIVVVGALAVALVIKTFLVQTFFIPSASMEPTLNVGDRVLVNKLSYRTHDVHRGDIIVFRRPNDDATSITVTGCNGKPVTIARSNQLEAEGVDDLIKRVVALPGENVEWRSTGTGNDGRIFINGKPLDEPYLPNGVTTEPFTFGAQCIKVPAHEVFVLGDNRHNSQASNAFGPIEESLIVGRAFVRIWPVSKFSTL